MVDAIVNSLNILRRFLWALIRFPTCALLTNGRQFEIELAHHMINTVRWKIKILKESLFMLFLQINRIGIITLFIRSSQLLNNFRENTNAFSSNSKKKSPSISMSSSGYIKSGIVFFIQLIMMLLSWSSETMHLSFSGVGVRSFTPGNNFGLRTTLVTVTSSKSASRSSFASASSSSSSSLTSKYSFRLLASISTTTYTDEYVLYVVKHSSTSLLKMIHYYLPVVKARWSCIQNIGIFPFHRPALPRYWQFLCTMPSIKLQHKTDRQLVIDISLAHIYVQVSTVKIDFQSNIAKNNVKYHPRNSFILSIYQQYLTFIENVLSPSCGSHENRKSHNY
ncbi:hypothetical protein T01_6496 [Trichinella spiralis]|uniref:Uncharacterized protein n=1 Tax=Trichinella spiralis TaxID=6334 RepID=A0A0V1B4R9_TRISP|nr:hypothetical protein T01_6496 [Trichinella spiralis]